MGCCTRLSLSLSLSLFIRFKQAYPRITTSPRSSFLQTSVTRLCLLSSAQLTKCSSIPASCVPGAALLVQRPPAPAVVETLSQAENGSGRSPLLSAPIRPSCRLCKSPESSQLTAGLGELTHLRAGEAGSRQPHQWTPSSQSAVHNAPQHARYEQRRCGRKVASPIPSNSSCYRWVRVGRSFKLQA